jgi:hypothetical protein
MKVLIMQLFPTSCNFAPPRSEYPPQHPVLLLSDTLNLLLPNVITPMQSHGEKYSSVYFNLYVFKRARDSIVVKALYYNPEGRGFDS